MGITWHPTIFQSEKVDFPNEPWIQSLVIPDKPLSDAAVKYGYHKNNAFIRSGLVEDEDYYICLDDDDMIEGEAIHALKRMNEDVVFISLKRGKNIPDREARGYQTYTLTAEPCNVVVGEISKQQLVTKGKVFKKLNFIENAHWADGIVATWLKQNYPVRYEPELYALFNYFEPGRW